MVQEEMPLKCQKCRKSFAAEYHRKCDTCRQMEFEESVFCELNLMEQWGSGIPRILQEAGL